MKSTLDFTGSTTDFASTLGVVPSPPHAASNAVQASAGFSDTQPCPISVALNQSSVFARSFSFNESSAPVRSLAAADTDSFATRLLLQSAELSQTAASASAALPHSQRAVECMTAPAALRETKESGSASIGLAWWMIIAGIVLLLIVACIVRRRIRAVETIPEDSAFVNGCPLDNLDRSEDFETHSQENPLEDCSWFYDMDLEEGVINCVHNE
jgi:hypothetical protein